MNTDRREQYILQETARQESRRAPIWAENFLTLFFLAGILLSVRDLYYSDLCMVLAFATGTVVVFGIQAADWFGRSAEKIYTGLYIGTIACVLLTIMALSQGFLDLMNRIFSLWNLRFGTELSLFAVGSGAAAGSLILWVLLAVPMSMILLSNLKKRRVSVLVFGSLLAFALGLLFRQPLLWPAVICIYVGIAGLFILYSAPDRKSEIRGIMAFIIIGIGISAGLYASRGYLGSESLTRWKDQVAEQIDEIRYGKDTLPKGKLADAADLLDGDAARLQLDTKEPQELYLRGFVGGTYDGTDWTELDQSAYQGEYEGMMKWLASYHFSPVFQYMDYQNLTDQANGEAAKTARVSVKNTGAYRKYVYLPASTASWSANASDEKRDWQVQATGLLGLNAYSFSAYTDAPDADSAMPADWLMKPSGEQENEYLDAESIYRSFVYDTYTQIDPDLENLVTETFYERIHPEDLDFQEITSRIRRVLRGKLQYQNIPAQIPAGTDAITWILSDAATGNAVYYASAAVMAYRAAGYPARYVEGYHLSADDAIAYERSGATSITLTTKNAHAWVEIYMDGIGWLPVEVVPGMYVESVTSQTVEGKPAYKVNSSRQDDGIATEDDNLFDDGGKHDEESEDLTVARVVYRVMAWILLILYTLFAIYCVLEIQRGIRILRNRKKVPPADPEERILLIIDEVTAIFHTAELEDSFLNADWIWEEMEETFPGLHKEEYIRVLDLVQKARFGGIDLKPYEWHTLACFEERLKTLYCKNAGIVKKLVLKYVYLWW